MPDINMTSQIKRELWKMESLPNSLKRLRTLKYLLVLEIQVRG